VIVVFIGRSYRRRARGGTPRALVEITTRTSLRLQLFPSIQITLRDQDDTDLMDVNRNDNDRSCIPIHGFCAEAERVESFRQLRVQLEVGA